MVVIEYVYPIVNALEILSLFKYCKSSALGLMHTGALLNTFLPAEEKQVQKYS